MIFRFKCPKCHEFGPYYMPDEDAETISKDTVIMCKCVRCGHEWADMARNLIKQKGCE